MRNADLRLLLCRFRNRDDMLGGFLVLARYWTLGSIRDHALSLPGSLGGCHRVWDRCIHRVAPLRNVLEDGAGEGASCLNHRRYGHYRRVRIRKCANDVEYVKRPVGGKRFGDEWDNQHVSGAGRAPGERPVEAGGCVDDG